MAGPKPFGDCLVALTLSVSSLKQEGEVQMKYSESGTPNYMKFLNKKKVLQFIMSAQNDSYCRADLAKELKISKPTISNIVDELISEGWVLECESEFTSSQGGRKPVFLLFNKNAKFVVGVDIGGTAVKLALLNLDGEIMIQSSLPTQKISSESLVERIANEIIDMVSQSKLDHHQILAVGVGAPGITDVSKGNVVEAPSLGWRNYPLKAELENLIPFRVNIENDVNVAVLGEQWRGVAKNKQHVILITLGTGVGCGIIINGTLYHGAKYAAGEVGYIITDKEKAKQSYPSMFAGYGFLENHVGGPAIVNQFLKILKSENMLALYDISDEEWTAKNVFKLAIEDDPLALRVIDDVIDNVGVAIINIVSILNPEIVVLGGGISGSGAWFLPKIKAWLKSHLPEQSQIEIQITKHTNVSLLGAVSLCLRNDELFNTGG